jgi:hypothetical protein
MSEPRDSLPDAFRADWRGTEARIHLPEMEQTEHHVYEPVLSRGDANRVADAIRSHDGHRVGGEPIAKVVIAHDPRYSRETVEKFRERVLSLLHEFDLFPEVVLESAAPRAAIEPVQPVPAVLAEPEPSIDPGADTDLGIEIGQPPPTPTVAEEPPLSTPAPSSDVTSPEPSAAPNPKKGAAPIPSRKRFDRNPKRSERSEAS